jgi:hypothetical protein
MTHDLEKILAQYHEYGNKKLPPVDLWHPDRVGTIDIVIDAQARWFHEGTIFQRAALMRLFSSILRLEDSTYYLVTPAEKLAIEVADVPFIIQSFSVADDGGILLLSNCDELIPLDVGSQWQLREFQGQAIPYVCVRNNLFARLSRNVFYQLIDKALQQGDVRDNELMLNVQGQAYSLGAITEE